MSFKEAFMYSELDILGGLSTIREYLEGYVSELAEEGKGFTVGNKVDRNQVDLLKTLTPNGEVLGNLFARLWGEYSDRVSANLYFLSHYMCYVEVPTFYVDKTTSQRKASFNKFLATANLGVAELWSGLDEELVEKKYGSHVEYFMEDPTDGVPYLKLSSTKAGRGITKPRKLLDFNTSGIRIVPVFLLKAYVDALTSKLRNDIARVTFIKDNGSTRELDTTLNSSKLNELYKDSSFVGSMLENSYDGNFLGSKVIDRGYIRVPEVGASVYDGFGVRAINYSRVVNIEYGVSPNMDFAHIDLDSVVLEFSRCLSKLSLSSIGKVFSALIAEGFEMGTLAKPNGEPNFLIDQIQLENWADLQNSVLSTTFQRMLAQFMLANPNWFGDYDGTKNSEHNKKVEELFGGSGLISLDDL